MTTDERLEILKELLLTNEKEPEKDVYKKIKALEKKQRLEIINLLELIPYFLVL